MIKKSYKNYKKILLLGAAGIGMSALARHVKNLNLKVDIHDDQKNQNFEELKKENFNEFKGDIQTYDLVIYSLAIQANHPIREKFNKHQIDSLSYPEALGMILKKYPLIAISGTHGKTTTTGMLIDIFSQNQEKFSALIGSKLLGHNNQNYIINPNSNVFIAEACEYQGGFLNYQPETLVITNLEHEHFDSFPSQKSYLENFQKLINQTQKNLILNQECKLSQNLEIPPHLNVSYFNKQTPYVYNLKIDHNNSNANAASLVASLYGIREEIIKNAIGNFKGTQRRQEIIFQNKHLTIIDDYAHHPTEITSTLKGIQNMYPNQKITLIYQPHQISRTKSLMQEFKNSLQLADRVIIPNIYKARDEKNMDDSQLCIDLCEGIGNKATYSQGLLKTKENFEKLIQKTTLLVIMGAGDVLKCLPDQYTS